MPSKKNPRQLSPHRRFLVRIFFCAMLVEHINFMKAKSGSLQIAVEKATILNYLYFQHLLSFHKKKWKKIQSHLRVFFSIAATLEWKPKMFFKRECEKWKWTKKYFVATNIQFILKIIFHEQNRIKSGMRFFFLSCWFFMWKNS